MGKGGSSQVKETEQEKALADVSQQKWDRYKTLYRDVEKDFIEDVSKDTSNLLKGRATADVAQASGDSMSDAVKLGYGGGAKLGATAENLGGARMLGAVGANKQAQELTDKGHVAALRVGHDMSADVQNGLSVAARAANSEAIAKAKAQATENAAMSDALGTVAGFGIAKYGDEIKGLGKTAPKDKMTKATGDDWNNFLGVS